jgi:hypothetical protein
MTVKTISKVESPLSDLLVAMTICNTAKFDDSAPSKEKGRKKSEAKVKIDIPIEEEGEETEKK